MTHTLYAESLAAVPHGFFGRGSALDDPADPNGAMANRRTAANQIIPDAPIALNHQVHGIDCRIISAPPSPDARPQADALATALPGILLGIHTADCAPVLFADSAAGVVGAAHAGWRGALAGVTDATLLAMESLGADRTRIKAAIGPCIGRSSYEVDDGFLKQFWDVDPQNDIFFSPARAGHHHFDLEAFVAHRLAIAGVQHVSLLGVDTCKSPKHWSHRRGTSSGAGEPGRQISFIGIKNVDARGQ
jgi:hypothetical protein